MQIAQWTCQYVGCRSTREQLDALRARRPDGFPHDEDPELRVCTVCRRLPLKGRQARGQLEQEAELDEAFLSGIKEELASIEENERNIQALSQVFRYYSKHAKQLSQVLYDFAVKQCFPWELIHALHLVDDILLMDNAGQYKAELTDRVQAITVNAFRKVQSFQEKREVARMLHAWQELKIFDSGVLEAIRAAIRAGDDVAAKVLDEASVAEEEDEDVVAPPEGRIDAGNVPFVAKKRRVDERIGCELADPRDALKPEAVAKVPADRVLTIVERILSTPVERPFELLGIAEDGSDGHDIRKAYRRIALLIHPDKNPTSQARCQEALIKLQQGRVQAESDLQRLDSLGDGHGAGETRSAATAAAANAAVDACFKCKYPGCDLPPCKQCANGCCTRNITHCHMVARSKAGMQCFFHPPPRAWARNA
mmetsp:Transcript_40122/g.93188  ORF Transcript_40122/g.93188 Transcript_40122/m.93188 type:complete len:424 (+) Transcript_40122:62-1333(+)